MTKHHVDRIGDVYGTRTVTGRVSSGVWLVKCSCGRLAKVCTRDLETGCIGCRESKRSPGERHGTRVLVRKSETPGAWVMRCDCGSEVTRFANEFLTPCAACSPHSTKSESAKKLFDLMVKSGTQRLTALAIINRLPPPRHLRLRHLLSAYRAAIAETMREEHGE